MTKLPYLAVAAILVLCVECIQPSSDQPRPSGAAVTATAPPGSGAAAAVTAAAAATPAQQCSVCEEPLINWPVGSVYCWNVRESYGEQQGPGNNVFRRDGVSVLPNGQLVLEVGANQATGEFSSAEVYLDRSLGFGDYVFSIATDPKLIHPGLVASPFLYANDTQEFDVEFARWGDPSADNSNFVVQPADESKPGSYKTFSMSGTRTTHRLRWGGPQLRQMRFESWSESGKLLKAWTPSAGNPIVTPGEEAVHINHWIFDKAAAGLPQRSQFVVNCFKFCPLSRQETCSTPLGKRPSC